MTHGWWPEWVSKVLVTGGLIGSAIASVMNLEGWANTIRKMVIGVTAAVCFGPLFEGPIDGLVKAAGADPHYGPFITGCVVGMNGMVFIELMVRATTAALKARIDGIFKSSTEGSDEKGAD